MTPSIKDNFCPKCGQTSDSTGLCTRCRIGSTPWFTCDSRVKNVQCPSCGATKQVNTWTDSTRERSELAPELAMSAVHFHKDARKPSVTMTVDDISVNRSRANLTVRATLYNQPVEGTCSVEIIWHKEQCDRCNRISGSYYEGIVQVRAEGRVPGTYEIQMAASISRHVEDTLQSGGERLSFISDITEIHDGLDIVIGSQHIGLLISQGIVAQLGGRYSSHPKLVGEKNGRQLYRITYLVRLPRFQKYDVVRSGNRYYEVEKVESHHVRTFDLRDGQSKSIRENDIGRIIGNARNAEPALVVFAHGDSVGILDPGTQQTRDVRGLPWMTIRAGDHVNILRDGDEPIIVR